MAFAFVAIIVAINLFTTNHYGRSGNEVVSALSAGHNLLGYDQLSDIVSNNKPGYLFIDLRPREEFATDHLAGAINIPFDELLNKKHIRTLKHYNDNVTVLYAGTESIAHSARLLLLAKGLSENILVLGGNYETAKAHGIDEFSPSWARYHEEKARFDYNRYMNTSVTQSTTQSTAPAGIIPAVNMEVKGAKGGC